MSKYNDLTGKRFGRLVVLKRGKVRVTPSGSKNPTWICRCDCGNRKEIIAYSLTHGMTKSCGCLQREKAVNTGKENIKPLADAARKDLTGMKFGKLLVLERLCQKASNGSFRYKCRCDCGNIVEVEGKHSLDRSTKSCGCYAKKIASKKIKALDLPHSTCYCGTKICSLNNTLSSRNTTGVKGCYWDKRKERYIVRIKCKGVQYNIGSFKTIEEAAKARRKAEEEIWEPVIQEYYKKNQ